MWMKMWVRLEPIGATDVNYLWVFIPYNACEIAAAENEGTTTEETPGSTKVFKNNKKQETIAPSVSFVL